MKTFDPIAYVRTEQRNITRLTRAAWAVMATSKHRNDTKPKQTDMVNIWVEHALRDRQIRLGQLPPECRD